MKGVLKNIGLLILTLILSYFLAGYFFSLYNYFWPSHPSGFFAAYAAFGQFIAGFITAWTLLGCVCFSAFGDKYKYWWIGDLLLPVLWFVVQFDLSHWYFYTSLAIVGWLIGHGISKVRRPKPAVQ